jgi:hypothetical protein
MRFLVPAVPLLLALFGAGRAPVEPVPFERAAGLAAPEAHPDEDALDGFRLAPYVLHLDHASFTLCWVSATPTPSRVVVATLAGERAYGDGAPRRFHRVVVDGLTPDTDHSYRIGGVYSAVVRTSAGDGRFRVASFGHVAGTEDTKEAPIEPLVDALSVYDADLTLVCGDITYFTGYRDFARHYFRRFERYLATRPSMVAPGNHDAGFPMHVPEGVPPDEVGRHIGFTYEVFRRLFPHDYGDPAEGAYYTFTRDHVRFVALSYCSDVMGGFGRQLGWLDRVLEADTSEFRIVFLGGASGPPREFDEATLFQVLAKHDVDLVLGGDGPGVFRDEVNGVPRHFAGSRNGTRRFHRIDFEPWAFTVQVVDVARGPLGEPERFESKRSKRVVRELAADDATVVERPNAARVLYRGLALPSDAFDGVEIEFDWPLERRTALQVLWAPEGVKRTEYGGDGYYFRARLCRLREPGRHTFRLRFPDRHPRTDEPFVLHDLMLKVQTPGGQEPVDLASMVRAVRFVADAEPAGAEAEEALPGDGAPRDGSPRDGDREEDDR